MLTNINLVAQDLTIQLNTSGLKPINQEQAQTQVATSIENLLKQHCGAISNFTKVGNKDVGTWQFNLNGNTYAIKRTTQNTTKTYNGDVMAVQHLRRFYTPVTGNKFIYILHVKYDPSFATPNIVRLALLEDINFSDFTIGNLGRAQLQLKNSSDITIPSNLTRQDWMKNFYDGFINNFIPQTLQKLRTDLTDSTTEESAW